MHFIVVLLMKWALSDGDIMQPVSFSKSGHHMNLHAKPGKDWKPCKMYHKLSAASDTPMINDCSALALLNIDSGVHDMRARLSFRIPFPSQLRDTHVFHSAKSEQTSPLMSTSVPPDNGPDS